MILRTTHKPPVQSLLIIRLKTSTSKTKMETVGALPAPDVILPTTIIHLFGIASENGTEEKKCHFCFGAIEAEELLAMDTPCCHQGAHCECFRYWAASSVVDETVRCGYCRTVFPDNQLCFLCLEKKNDNEQLMVNNCCHTTVHAECTTLLRSVLSQLPFDVFLECGHTYCWSEDCLQWHETLSNN